LFLPFWTSELQVEIPSWFPWGKDYQPVSINRFHDRVLRDISALCFDLDSEFYFMASPLVGYVGSLPREKYFQDISESTFHLGFLMVFAFSEKIEKALIASLALTDAGKGLSIGLTFCSLWRGGVYEGKMKVIAIASDEPFYDGTKYLESLVHVLRQIKNVIKPAELSYYAEKFGYNRFSLEAENINHYDVRVTEILSEIEDDGAKDIVGGSPMINFPPFFGFSITAVEK